MERYSRHILLPEIGESGQQQINRAKVLVIGAGGLGCPVLQYLTAAGVGQIGIVDFDRVEVSNLQRQILFSENDIGVNKALVAKARLKALNSTISFKTYSEKLLLSNAFDIIRSYDIVVDGTDNFETRYLINDVCIQLHKPVVYGAIYKFEGQVSVFNYQDGPSYRCLFPETPQNSIPNCSEVGVLGVLPGIIGTMQANEVLKIIIGNLPVLSGRLLNYSAKTGETYTYHFSANKALIKEIRIKTLKSEDYQIISLCDTDIQEVAEISLSQIAIDDTIQWIDVRNPEEIPVIKHPEIIKIPLASLENKIPTLDKNQKTIVFCQSGNRSKKATAILQQEQFKEVYSFKGTATTIQSLFNTKIAYGQEN
ncbi:ThiF family adenylyltransferase [Aquimarina sp. ERC-38]|uniref:ThiF family adenylyltransferase n=1 Tax=Aquimarina sp. ERC-38 TaxID=2949996 RepID=UPI00224753F5|nr:ThiF family adenylyltransferase [Aquimarina sp. ERC-38]UZO79253.1 ThiF family adenylyltransferase [Aquimarina sp. ERC-38]